MLLPITAFTAISRTENVVLAIGVIIRCLLPHKLKRLLCHIIYHSTHLSHIITTVGESIE